MNDRDDYIKGLRELADRLEAHPDTVLPYHGSNPVIASEAFYCHSEAQMAATLRAFPGVKSITEHGKIRVDGNLHGFRYHVTLLKGVCELVETGEVEEYEDVEIVREAETRTVIKTRPKVERICPDSLLALGDQVPA